MVSSLTVELRGEGVVGDTDTREDGREKRTATHAHPDDLATSIRPYDGSAVM